MFVLARSLIKTTLLFLSTATIPSSVENFAILESASFSLFKRWVIEEMRLKNFHPFISYEEDDEKSYFCWGQFHPCGVPGMDDVYYFKPYHKAEIKDNEILSAAIEAACEYLEGENE